MALARIRRGDSGMNYWPGFVDALSTLILGIIFLLTVFVVVQFYLQQEVAGKDTALGRLNAQIAQLTELLSMEKSGKANLDDQLAQLRATLASAENERDRLKGTAENAGAGVAAAQGKVSELTGQLEGEKKISARAFAQVEVLNQQIAALRRQLAALEQTLDASKRRTRNPSPDYRAWTAAQSRVAESVNELKRYRSDFSESCVKSSVTVRTYASWATVSCCSRKYFSTRQGRPQARRAGRTRQGGRRTGGTGEAEFRPDLAWVFRVDGHTDVRQNVCRRRLQVELGLVGRARHRGRADLVGGGVSPQRLVAAGFGEFQPIDLGKTEDASAQSPHRIQADRAVALPSCRLCPGTRRPSLIHWRCRT